MSKIGLTVAYLGGRYVGWQRQPAAHGRSVQQVLEEALGRVLRETVQVHAASRTDAGVHAWGQVVHLTTAKPLPVDRLAQVVNRQLPADIRVLGAVEVSPAFHARYDTQGKIYRYHLSQEPLADRNVFAAPYYWSLGRDLDVASMQEAAALLVGRHDFAAFSVSGRPVASTWRTLYRVTVGESAPAAVPFGTVWPPLLTIEVWGDGFLYKMVRMITARLVQVGLGRLQPQEMAALLAGTQYPAVGPAPAQGLTLLRVIYQQADWRQPAENLLNSGENQQFSRFLP